MHLSKLVSTLRVFDSAGIKRLKEYIHSPYFHVPLASVNLFDYLYEWHPSLPEVKLNPKLIARHSKNLASPVTQAAAGTRLMHCIEEFIGIEHALQDKPA